MEILFKNVLVLELKIIQISLKTSVCLVTRSDGFQMFMFRAKNTKTHEHVKVSRG